MLVIDGVFGETTVNVAGAEVPPAVVTVIDSVPGDAMSLLRICARSVPESTNVDERKLPLTLTLEVEVKLLPRICSVNDVPPELTVDGFRSVTNGVAVPLTVSVTVFETTLFGFRTVMLSVRAVATSVDGMAAVSVVALTNVVGRELPLTRTTAVLPKFWPVTVSVNAPLPMPTCDGSIDEMAGEFGRTVNVTAAERELPGLATTTCSVAGWMVSVAKSCAVRCWLSVNVVERLPPFTRTIAPEMKLLPAT